MAKIKNNGTIINTDYQFAKLIDRTIENAVIPTSIKTIGAYSFQNSRVKSLYIPKNVKTIGTNAFYTCSSLAKVDFEDNGVTSIGQNAFQNCSVLEILKLPYSLQKLGANCFQNCSNLKKVIFPATFSESDRWAFQNCSALTYVFFKGNNPVQSITANNGYFTNCNNMRLFDMRHMLSAKDKASTVSFSTNNYLYINVPDSLYAEFTALTNWSKLTLKRWVHSCDVASFDDIENPVEGDYYSLKGDTNYLNPIGEKQIDIRQYVSGQWIEIDIG